MDEFLTGYDPQSDAYRAAFAVFLAHTDQKTTAFAWLDRLVRTLPARKTFIAAGAATGARAAARASPDLEAIREGQRSGRVWPGLSLSEAPVSPHRGFAWTQPRPHSLSTTPLSGQPFTPTR
jgi:hypothetical protein